jgi:hypothetical protein
MLLKYSTKLIRLDAVIIVRSAVMGYAGKPMGKTAIPFVM